MLRMVKAALMMVMAVSVAVATPVTATLGQWYEFSWFTDTELGSQAPVPEDGFLFDLTDTGDATVRVTDRGGSGDAFDIYIGGVLTYQTPSVPSFNQGSIDPDLAWADPDLSKTSFLLTGGSPYTVTIHIREKAADFGFGSAYIRGDGDVVPEPSTYALLGGGLLLFGVIFRRRKKA
jgi:hypothetical protein